MIYFFLFTAFLLYQAYGTLSALLQLDFIAAFSMVIYVIYFLGLAAYVYDFKVMRPISWRLAFILSVGINILLLYVAYVSPKALYKDPSRVGRTQENIGAILVFILLCLPMMVALFKLGFTDAVFPSEKREPIPEKLESSNPNIEPPSSLSRITPETKE